MYNWEKSRRNRLEKQSPSFSSTLLDKIYRSIDEGEPNGGELKLRPETTVKKQSRSCEEDEALSLRQACLLDKWMEQNAKVKISQRRHFSSELDRNDYDALFFSSGSNSSDSSSGALSSSDTDSFYNPKPTKSCFSRPKPIRLKAETHAIDDYHFSHQQTPKSKSKSRALRMYGNLKNLKQPISPGGRLVSFVNSIFTGNAKKAKNPSPTERVPTSTCSSASSFSRSCLSKNSQASVEKLRNGDKRSVQFCPVSKDLRSSLHKEREELKPMSIKEEDADLKLQETEKSRRAIDFLKQCHQNHSKRSDCDRYDENEDEEDDDDASCASSDLFELDHLAVLGDKYRDELPVYETTRVDRNRPISNRQ